jgi:hypothetical protein
MAAAIVFPTVTVTAQATPEDDDASRELTAWKLTIQIKSPGVTTTFAMGEAYMYAFSEWALLTSGNETLWFGGNHHSDGYIKRHGEEIELGASLLSVDGDSTTIKTTIPWAALEPGYMAALESAQERGFTFGPE